MFKMFLIEHDNSKKLDFVLYNKWSMFLPAREAWRAVPSNTFG